MVSLLRSFCLGDLLVSLNDDVLIRSSDDNDDSEDVENCFIGRVEILYERGTRFLITK